MHMWFNLPIILQVEQVVDGLGSNNLTKALMATLMKCGGVTREEVAKTLLCFDLDGATLFQGGKHVSQTK